MYDILHTERMVFRLKGKTVKSNKNKGKQSSDGFLSVNEVRVLGEAFWNIVHHYGFNREEQATILGIKYNRQRLKSLEDEMCIPDDIDKKNRVGILLGIHKNLRILFPHNREIVYSWMKTPQSDLNNLIPIEYIMQSPEESLFRLAAIRRRLDYIRCAE